MYAVCHHMSRRFMRLKRQPCRALKRVGLLACLCLPLHGLADGDTSLSFPLTRIEEGGNHHVRMKLDGREVAFNREPAFDEDDVVRGAVKMGPGRADFVGFVWDRPRGKLHLDANRNLDLTDDDPVPSQNGGARSYQQFTDITLVSPGPGAPRQYDLSMSLSSHGANQRYGNVTVQSGWRGELALPGGTWTLTVIDNMDGQIDGQDSFYLRRVEGGDTPPHPMTQLHRFDGTERLFLDGHHYALSFSFDATDAGTRLRAVFDETPTPMGTLELKGQHIRRLILTGESLVVLDRPAGTVRVPAHRYTGRCLVSDPEEERVYETDLPTIQVHENEITEIRSGAPLLCWVDASRNGRYLKMRYKLVGNGGRRFEAVGDVQRNPPRVVIRHNGEEVHSGTFEYG